MRTRKNVKRIYRSSASRQEGFTLIELLIAVAVTAVVAALAYGVLFQGLANFSAESEEVEAQSNVRYALTYLSRQIRKGTSITVEDPYGSFGKALNVDGIHYYRDGQYIYEDDPDADDPIPLVAGIGSMSIAKSGAQITMTITSIADSRGNTVTETMDIYLRE